MFFHESDVVEHQEDQDYVVQNISLFQGQKTTFRGFSLQRMLHDLERVGHTVYFWLQVPVRHKIRL